MERAPFGTADRDNKKELMGQGRLSISRQRLSSARVLMGRGGMGKSVKETVDKKEEGEGGRENGREVTRNNMD